MAVHANLAIALGDCRAPPSFAKAGGATSDSTYLIACDRLDLRYAEIPLISQSFCGRGPVDKCRP